MARGRPTREQRAIGGLVYLRCSGCEEWKPLDQFHRKGARGSAKYERRKSQCKRCDLETQRRWRHGGGKQEIDDDALRERELEAALKSAPRVIQVRDGHRVGERRKPPLCVIPPHHPAYIGPAPTNLFAPPPSLATLLGEYDASRGIVWPLAAD